MNNFTAMLIVSLLLACLYSPAWLGALVGAILYILTAIIIDLAYYALKKMAGR